MHAPDESSEMIDEEGCHKCEHNPQEWVLLAVQTHERPPVAALTP